MIDYRVYLVTDDPSRYAGNWLDNVRAAVEGGVTCVQYRDTENAPQVSRLRELVRDGSVDCIGVGPVFDARKTKADAAEALGPDGLRAIVSLVPDVPNCAIGGITLANAPDVIAAGAKGLAVVSAFSKAEDPHEVAKAFRLLFDRCGK